MNDVKIGEVDEAFLTEGDHSATRGTLRFRRIRVERQPVIRGEVAPLLCRCGERVFLAGGSGTLMVSADGGLTWQRVGNVSSARPSGRLCALHGDSDGALIAAFRQEGRLALTVSRDGGESFSPLCTIPGIPADGKRHARFLVPARGQMLLAIDDLVFTSTDEGATWSELVRFPADWSGARPVVLSTGTMLAAVLVEDESRALRNTSLVESVDGGRTWREPVCATRRGQVPGDLIELPDGRLVLTYGEETNPYGARAILSRDGGKSWENLIYVLSVGRWEGAKRKPKPLRCHPASGAASVILEDGTILSAFDRGPTERDTDEAGNRPGIVSVQISVGRWAGRRG